ncbi:hypothetical protein KCU67_g36, partial [Aureobasidium melanogenum]
MCNRIPNHALIRRRALPWLDDILEDFRTYRASKEVAPSSTFEPAVTIILGVVYRCRCCLHSLYLVRG